MRGAAGYFDLVTPTPKPHPPRPDLDGLVGPILSRSQPSFDLLGRCGGKSEKSCRAYKNKIGTPPQNPKYPPPLKRGILWTWFFLQNGRIFPGVHKIGATISGPRIADKNFTDTRIFLSKIGSNSGQNRVKQGINIGSG